MNQSKALQSSLLMLFFVLILLGLAIQSLSPGKIQLPLGTYFQKENKFPRFESSSNFSSKNNSPANNGFELDIDNESSLKNSTFSKNTPRSNSYQDLHIMGNYLEKKPIIQQASNSQYENTSAPRARKIKNQKKSEQSITTFNIDNGQLKQSLAKLSQNNLKQTIANSDMNVLSSPDKAYIPIAPNDPGTVAVGDGTGILVMLAILYSLSILFRDRAKTLLDKNNILKITIIGLVSFTSAYSQKPVNESTKVINIPSSTDNLFLGNSSKLVVKNSTIFYIAGDLKLNSGESNSTQISSTSSITVAGQTILEKTFNGNKWYFFSLPFDVTEDRIFKVVSGVETAATWGDAFAGAYVAGKDLYIAEYDTQNRDLQSNGSPNSSGAGLYWKNLSTRTIQANKGYIVALDGSSSMTFRFKSAAGAASVNIDAVTRTISKSATSGQVVNHSWNLVGNPYLSGFDLKDASNHKPYYLYDGSTYKTIIGDISDAAADRQMQPFSAFFCQAFDASSSVNFSSSGRMFKAPSSVENLNYQILKLGISKINQDSSQDSSESVQDAVRIRIGSQFDEKFILGEDAVKMAGLDPSIPQIFTSHEDIDFSVLSIPTLTQETNLKVYLPEDGEFTLRLLLPEYAKELGSIKIFDSQENKTYPISETNSFRFYGKKGISNRFLIQSVPSDITNLESEAGNEIKIAVQKGKINITGIDSPTDIRICDLSGKILYSAHNSTSNQDIKLEIKGLVILYIQNNNKNIIEKIRVN